MRERKPLDPARMDVASALLIALVSDHRAYGCLDWLYPRFLKVLQ